VERTGSPTWSKGWLALSAVVAPRYAAKSVRTLPLCDVSRPSMTCPFRMVLGAVVAVAAGERAVGTACGRVPNGAGGVGLHAEFGGGPAAVDGARQPLATAAREGAVRGAARAALARRCGWGSGPGVSRRSYGGRHPDSRMTAA
jgi:hypothetical protein